MKPGITIWTLDEVVLFWTIEEFMLCRHPHSRPKHKVKFSGLQVSLDRRLKGSKNGNVDFFVPAIRGWREGWSCSDIDLKIGFKAEF